ncbi:MULTISPECIES: hypothetical protein [unclassified Mesorhizobium]|uniref:hypothetical protein n=1 Tax=unclassified Mesorhizobium TaxID=325217 RepID=UPI001CCE65AE|nr:MULTISPECIES: hypothetical protein [unclassified Mesorhizobium]MBZ9684284.1 hypothetical protein [Mesorhizobium sp. CO1-1-2]MBZ9923714.1 hypothetical protein [Mesorhizobium sp. BR1-1-4]
MAEASNANEPNEAVVDIDKHGEAVQRSISIVHFWDKNRLVMPWMEGYLPSNRMWEDGIATVFSFFAAFCIFGTIFHVILKSDKVFAAV